MRMLGPISAAADVVNKQYVDGLFTPTLASLMGASAIGGESAYLYWDGDKWVERNLGAAAFFSVADSTSVAAVGTTAKLVTERDVYYGLASINNARQTSLVNIFAPTSAGASGNILVSNGEGAPSWKSPSDIYSVATDDAAGLMSAADKTKLDAITASADSVSFSRSLTSGTKIGTITINGTATDLYCQTNTNTTYSQATSSALGLVKIGYSASGKNYAVQLNDSGQMYVNVPWTDTNTTYSAATTSAAGLMSAADKTKLDAITASADSVSFSRSLTSGTKIGTITINGTATDLYCQTNTNTNYYPTTWTWTAGTTSGPTASLSGSGMTAVSIAAIPSASASASGIVTTGAQTFAGAKTFSTSIILPDIMSSPNSGLKANSTVYNIIGLDAIGGTGSLAFGQYAFANNAATTLWGQTIALYYMNTAGSAAVGLSIARTGAVAVKSISQSSDMLLKDISVYICPDVNRIAGAPIFDFRWKDENSELYTGTSAQYWRAILPNTVKAGINGSLSMDYGAAALVSAVAVARKSVEHEARIQELEKTVLVQQNEIQSLKNQLNIKTS